MITYDRPSNSILVANASATQLAEIQQLIEQFDKPARSDSVEIRANGGDQNSVLAALRDRGGGEGSVSRFVKFQGQGIRPRK